VAESPSLADREVVFGPFRLDVVSHRLWRGEREIPLRPKSWDVLCYLVGRPGHLVTKEALHRAIWADTAVSDDTLTKSIGELRQALGDSSRSPRFIQTVHGRGFRFVAETRDLGDATSGPTATAETWRLTAPSHIGATGLTFVGRQPELGRLHECFRLAGQGARQFVFITGEAGIGKTALTEAFLSSPVFRASDVCVLHGQCVEQHGQREPYMPMLEALERAMRSSLGPTLIPLLRGVAPCWYVQIPWLLSESESPAFHSAMLSAPPQRMLREIGAFLESMAVHSTVVLVLEDLHWSDHATTDLLAFLAERRDPARLLIIGTYRPAEASTQEHPIREVKQSLRSHRRCIELALDYLSVAAVREYLRRRFGDPVQDLAPLIHERTDGNPLFVVAIVEDLIRRGQLTNTGSGWMVDGAAGRVELAVPEDLLEMFGAQLQSVSADERAVLEAASVAGVVFAPWTVGRALGRDVEDVETKVQHMARSHLFLNTAGRAEDSGQARLYGFSHALHHQVIYEQIPDERRRRLHQSIGEALESTSGERLAEIAPELSVHFERSGDHARAIKYLALCIARAQHRFAYQEAVAYGRHALDLLGHVPETSDRDRLELEVRVLLSVSLNFTRGYGSPEVRENFERAGALCTGVGEARQLFEIVHAVWYAQSAVGELEGARRSVDELARIAERHQAAEFHLRAELARGRTEFWTGNFGPAVRHLTQFLEGIEKQPVGLRPETYGADPAVAGFMQGGLALWFLGRPEQARASARRGLSHAESSRQPFSIASALVHSAILELLCRDAEAAAGYAARAANVSAANAIALFRPFSQFFRGAALAEQGDTDGGLSEMLPSLAEHRAITGPHLAPLMLGFVAAANGRAGHWDEGLRRADEGIALTETTSERMYAAELWRLKGELLLGRSRAARPGKRAAVGRVLDAAQECFHRALEIARKQEARALALRSALSLARLSVRSHEARELLRSLYASFTEGFDTKDLEDARAFLNEPASP
jgi:DNA-binding winged helix-turn-helix (wHTH) protein/tetratricopeptide (TPR) repeat protein